MDAIKIDKMDAALKLIDALFRRGEINQATYNNILQHQNLHISQIDKKRYNDGDKKRRFIYECKQGGF